jgi:hypothetical protein
MADVEFPRRPLLRRVLERRPIPDDCRPREAHGVPGVELDAPNSRAMNEIGTTNRRKVEMSTGRYVDPRKVGERLPRRPLDEIASLVQGLTYGEMMELAEVLWKVQPEGSAITQENLPELLHRWSKSHSATAHVLEEPPTERRLCASGPNGSHRATHVNHVVFSRA